jgi:hypothetical protein
VHLTTAAVNQSHQQIFAIELISVSYFDIFFAVNSFKKKHKEKKNQYSQFIKLLLLRKIV